jgi:tetratricopeptide (TPR) repeat protein
VPCSGFLVLWWNDVKFWNYSYQTLDRYRQAQFWLIHLGPFLFGAFLFLIAAAWWIRRHRRRAVRRAEHFHTGTGELPPDVDPSVSAALVLAVAAIGWGWWGAAPAILLGLTAVVRRACGCSTRLAWRGILAALVIALAAGLWASWRASVVGRFEEALGAFEQGIAAGQQDRLPEAKQHFERAIAACPQFGNAYQGLGLVYARSGDPEAAYRELSRAIERYPTEPRGSWGPDQDIVGAAYRNRAKVARQLGLTSQAESDEKEAAKFTPFLDIFGGWLHWW